MLFRQTIDQRLPPELFDAYNGVPREIFRANTVRLAVEMVF
jgi:hypothetical protein